MLHGECVALGIIAAAYISWQRELLSSDEYYEIRDMFLPFGLPLTIEDIDVNIVLEYTKSDKKMNANGIKFILLKDIGKAFIETNVTDEEIIKSIHEIYFSEDDMKA